jgi:hypothetical protein
MIANLLNKLTEAMNTFIAKEIPKSMTTSGQPRKWFLDSVSWDKTLKMEDLRSATDRESLNGDYVSRFKVDDVKSRKGISALKIEISQLYSFNRSFIQRYQPRVQYYRADLSQKGGRTMYNVWQSVALFKTFKNKLDT